MTAKLQEQYREMWRRSFEPRQWFIDEESPSDIDQEVRIMWVYRKTGNGLYTVGFYSPDKEWHADSDHPTQNSAAQRVRWLNGGSRANEG